MSHLFPGFNGIVVGLATFILVWLVVCLLTGRASSFEFDAPGEKGAFEKLLPIYLHAAEFILGLAAGSIVLLVGSSAFRASGRLPWFFDSPLFLLAFSIIYGIFFMVFLIFDYEGYRHHPTLNSYTRFKYTRNQALGFGALLCFCIGYLWLLIAVSRYS
jgi:hypothetical protein